jgi:hypothetical protein
MAIGKIVPDLLARGANEKREEDIDEVEEAHGDYNGPAAIEDESVECPVGAEDFQILEDDGSLDEEYGRAVEDLSNVEPEEHAHVVVVSEIPDMGADTP